MVGIFNFYFPAKHFPISNIGMTMEIMALDFCVNIRLSTCRGEAKCKRRTKRLSCMTRIIHLHRRQILEFQDRINLPAKVVSHHQKPDVRCHHRLPRKSKTDEHNTTEIFPDFWLRQ